MSAVRLILALPPFHHSRTAVNLPRFFLPALAALLLSAGCDSPAPEQAPADLILRNGRIVTMDPARPEAQALAVRGDTIVAVGTNEAIDALAGPSTEVLDVEGQFVMPGFIEGHGHYMGLGRARMILDLTQARSWDEIVAMVEEAARTAEPGAWILGRGWHQEKWATVPENTVEGVPTHHGLSAVSPQNPVLLTHASGHAAFANAEALRQGGVSAETPDPPGGEIVRDARGEPTGLLRETAQGLVSRALERARAGMTPEEREAEMRRMAALAAEEALAHGITSFHDAGVSFETVDFYKRLADEGNLPVRLYVMIRAATDELAEKMADYRLVGYGNGYLTVRALKRSLDGALGSHGAWLLEPYADMPSSTGLQTDDLDDLARLAELAVEHGYQMAIHAIGDRANREVLDLYERTFAAHPEATDLRWRIEHAQHLHPDDIPRFGQLGVIASMQGIHCTSDAPWVLKRLGERRAREGAYMWQALWQTGAVVTNGTDVPVEPIAPIASFYATVTRRLADGSVFYPEQRLTREQALQSYTWNNAYAAFEEDRKGRLAPGYLADIVVLSQDLLTVPDDAIPETEVRYTIVGGQVRYPKP
ncbi:MAG: amidohydrolase [Rhodothermaceae bacterium]|nr:MAG: amidohydrolase [Rhodothermaceae bacterium]